jgi:hypothetical protein
VKFSFREPSNSAKGILSPAPTPTNAAAAGAMPEVSEDGDLCSRCDQVVSAMDAAE